MHRRLTNTLWVAAVILSTCGISGCLEVDRTQLELSWQLPGEASCVDAGIVTIQVQVTSTQLASAVFPCADGRYPDAVALGEFEPGIVKLSASGLDADGTEVAFGEGQQAIRGSVQRAELALAFVP